MTRSHHRYKGVLLREGFESLRFRHIQSPDYSGLFAFLGHRKTTRGNILGRVYFGRASDTFLLGRFRQRSNSAINPLGNVALGVTQQQAGMVDIDDFDAAFGRISRNWNWLIRPGRTWSPAATAALTASSLASSQRWRSMAAVTRFPDSVSRRYGEPCDAFRSSIFRIKAPRAAFDSIHLKHDPQLLVGLLLLHAEGFVLDVIPSHH
uniref:Uncharacterized protein n=1 Tax=Pseudomonas vlassakiae TaxID=485888 RepID=A0A923K3L4_9PSED